MIDWAGWALFGLAATAALTAIMITAQLAGLTRLDLPLLLGNCLRTALVMPPSYEPIPLHSRQTSGQVGITRRSA